MLFEIKVEGGITRFMALFTDYNNIPDIGPVRSARDQFFRLVLPWQPLYVHIGQSLSLIHISLPGAKRNKIARVCQKIGTRCRHKRAKVR